MSITQSESIKYVYSPVFIPESEIPAGMMKELICSTLLEVAEEIDATGKNYYASLTYAKESNILSSYWFRIVRYTGIRESMLYATIEHQILFCLLLREFIQTDGLICV